MVESSTLLVTGLGLDLVGALLLAAPDLPVIKPKLTPERYEEARRQLLDTGYIVQGDDRYPELWSIVEEHIDAVEEPPHRFALNFYPEQGVEAIYAVFEKGGDGPFAGLDDDPRKPIESIESEDYDWLTSRDAIYKWFGDEILRHKHRTRQIRGIGAGVLSVGFLLQIVSFLV